MRRAAILALACAACVEHRVLDVPLDAYAFEYGFMALVSEKGVTRISKPFGVANGALTFGTLPSYDLTEDENAMLLIGLPEGTVRSIVPLFDASRADRLELVERSMELPFYESAAGEYLSVKLPEDALVLRGDFENPLVDTDPPELALKVPFQPESCRRLDDVGLVPFGIQASIIPGDQGSSQENFLQVELVEEDLALAVTSKSLYLFRADEPYVPVDVKLGSPGNRVDRDVTIIRQYQFQAFAFDRMESRVWLVGTNTTAATLVELSIDGAALAHVKTTTIAGKQNDIALLPDHRPVLLSGGGVLSAMEEGSLVPLSALPLSTGEEAWRIHVTDDPEMPLFASSTSSLYVFRPTEGWIGFEVPSDWLQTVPVQKGFRGNGLAHSRNAAGELELWAAGTSSVMVRKVGDQPWAPYPIEYPPRFEGCSNGLLPYPQFSDNDGYDGIAIDGDDLFVTVRACSTALQIRRTTPCVALVSLLGEAAVLLLSDLQAIHVLADTIIIGGEDGLLYRGTLR